MTQLSTSIGFIVYDDEGNICWAGKGDLVEDELRVDSQRNILKKGIRGKEPSRVVYQDGREARVVLVDEIHYEEVKKHEGPFVPRVKLWFRETN